MKTQTINILFLLTLCSISITITSKNLQIESHPLYNIMMAQMSIMTEEKTENGGFDRVLGLLGELKSHNTKELEVLEKQKKNITLNCEVTNSSLSLNLNNLEKMLANYTHRLQNIPSKENVSKLITENERSLKQIIAIKQDYSEAYNETMTEYNQFVGYYNQTLKLINSCGVPKIQALYNSSKPNSTYSQTWLALIVDEYTACFRQYDNILTKHLVEFDDSPKLTFKKAIAYYLNNSDYDCIDGNYLKGYNSTLELNKIIHEFLQYEQSKVKFFANHTDQILHYDAAIKGIRKTIADYHANLKGYDEMKKDLVKLINGTESAISNINRSINLLQKDCNIQINSLKEKVSTL